MKLSSQSSCFVLNQRYYISHKGGLDRCLPERECLNVTSWPHVRGQPQKLSFQVCFERLNFGLNA